MSTPILIARIGALIYLCVGLSVYINGTHFRKIVDELVKSPGVEYVSSIFALILGSLMIASYNVWVWDWTVLITILGWGALLKGVLGLLLPAHFLKTAQHFTKLKSFTPLAGLSIVLGLVLGYYGFFA